LSDNKLGGEEIQKIAQCKSIKSLMLGGNKIQKVSDLEPLKSLELIELEMVANPAAEKDPSAFRKEIFELLGSSLEILDDLDINGDPVEEEEEFEEEDEDLDDLSEEDFLDVASISKKAHFWEAESG
jgi:hypothetical protein